jgi:hypothetical protein
MMVLLLFVTFWDYSYDFDLDFTYDDNIYAYSQQYIDDYLSGIRSYRFPFETYDDLVTSFDFALLVRNRFFGKRTTTFSLDVNTDNYLLNNQKNFQKYTFGMRQSFGRYAVKASYQVIPRYLIRYYRDPSGESTDYIGCEATYHTASAKVSFTTVRDITLTAEYGHRWDDYIPEFNRYDANGHAATFGIEKELSRYLDFAFSYEFRNSNTDPADAMTSGIDLTPDGSFYQHALGADFSIQVSAALPTTVQLSYDYGFRSYNTSTSDDSLHFGRRDHRHLVSLITYSRIITGLRLKLILMRQWRAASSEIMPDIDEIKDYVRYRAGAGVEFYY